MKFLNASLLLVTLSIGCARPSTAPGSARIKAPHDIARRTLSLDPNVLSHEQVRLYLRGLDDEARVIRETLAKPHNPQRTLDALNQHFFGPNGYAALSDLPAPENISLAAVLDHRRGACIGLAIGYLALAHRLGLDAHAAATPVHVFIRVRLPDRGHNVELMEGGRELDDAFYGRRYKIDQPSVDAGVFMADLTNAEVIAHLVSNQAVALSRAGKVAEALARYDLALKLHPKLVAAWYNRGIDLMNAGRLQEAVASFDHAIDLYPSDAQAFNNRGLAKARLGDTDGARADFTRALELDPAMREAGENLRKLLSPSAP